MIKYRQLHVGSDCTGPYEVTISLPMTVGEFISELLETYPNEWGCIGIYQKGEIFGNPYCEYKHGKLVDTLPVKYMDMQIESVNGSGGWTNSDYILHIKEEQKISDEEESGKIDQTAARLTNLTVMARLLTTEELLELRKIVTKEISKREGIKESGDDKEFTVEKLNTFLTNLKNLNCGNYKIIIGERPLYTDEYVITPDKKELIFRGCLYHEDITQKAIQLQNEINKSIEKFYRK